VKSLFPFSQETIVSSYDAEEVYRRLWSVTEPTGDDEWEPDVDKEALRFNGRVENDKFRLSLKVKRANNFLPLMRGRIEATSLGSIVFIHYRLFLWTLSFLIFWSVLTSLFALYFLVYEKIYINAAFSLLLGLANYVIALLNFRKQVRVSSKALREVLE
jgi:hypothetical protein